MQFSTVIGPLVFDAPASACLIATYLIRHIATCTISRFTISCNKACSKKRKAVRRLFFKDNYFLRALH